MKNLSRGSWLALASLAAIPAVAYAATSDRGPWNMSAETRSRLDEGRVAMVKAALKLTPDQEKLWAPVETEVRAAFKAREDRRAEWQKKREERKAEKADKSDAGDKKRGDLAERFDTMSKRMSERAERMKAFSTAFSPFYAALSDDQKDVLRPLVKEFGPGFGGGHHGPRWAMGGWGPGGGPEGGMGRHHGRHGGPGGGPDGGPAMDDDQQDGKGGPPPPAENAPDKKG